MKMELRTLKYFIEIANEESITKAAEKLHITQPTLSRQILQLEEELGKKLYIRENYGIRLTEDGILLRKRAEEISELEEKIRLEFSEQNINGTIYIGAGETDGIKYVAKILKKLREQHNRIKFRMISGDSEDITDKLDRGLIDFGIFVGKVNLKKYDFVTLPYSDKWGVIMRKDDEFSGKKFIVPEDLRERELLFSHQAKTHGEFSEWLGYSINELNIIGTHNLMFNASIMVREKLGILVTIEGIANLTGESELKFVPLKPELKAKLVLAWKKEAVFSRAAKKFLEFTTS
ncbi:MAG: LysR family transcriptional regulator [Synergistaceae bacterium]|nr:LysR family transcriptional regulator [Synergistaceae bacterium]